MKSQILIIDDSVDIRIIIKQMLKAQFQVDVVESESGNEGIGQIKNAPFDLIICDLNMPNGSGLDVFYYLSQFHPKMLERFIFFVEIFMRMAAY